MCTLQQYYNYMVTEIRFILPNYPSLPYKDHTLFKTVGEYLEEANSVMKNNAEFSSPTQNIAKAELKKFEQCRQNIEHAAATLIQKKIIHLFNKNQGLIGPANLRQRNHPATFIPINESSESDYSTESNIQAAEEAAEKFGLESYSGYSGYSSYSDDEEWNYDDEQDWSLDDEQEWLEQERINGIIDDICESR